MARVDVVSDGDLILAVGNDDSKLELRVYSLVLRLNSPVFRAMLGLSWAEGQAFVGSTSSSPGKIDLPDDDPEAMRLLCLVLHSQNDKITHSPSPIQLRDFASAADKYGCLMAVNLVAEAWLSRISMLKLGVDDRAAVFHAVYLFVNAKYFTKFVQDIIKYNDEDDWKIDPQKTDIGHTIMAVVMAMYSEQYRKLCDRITEIVEDLSGSLDPLYDHATNHSPEETSDDEDKPPPTMCTYYMQMVPIQQQALVRAGLWP